MYHDPALASVAKADPTAAEIQAQLEKAGDELEVTVEAYNKINETLAATQAEAAKIQAKIQEFQKINQQAGH